MLLTLHQKRPFGEIKSVRLPRKQGGKQHRGFAFVTFLTKEDAKYVLPEIFGKISNNAHILILAGMQKNH